MSLGKNMDDNEYIVANGLDRLIDFQAGGDAQRDVYDSVSGKRILPFPLQVADLVRLHKLVRSRKCFTVLEFGIGYSTMVMADALRKNEIEWNALPDKPEVRNRFMFKIFSVDASMHWIEQTKGKIPEDLRDRVHVQQSDVVIGTHIGQICHYYKNLPDVVPDFIYLDGPTPKDVQGQVNGLSFQCDERTVMSADLLLMEPTFLPGTFIIIDGRTNNARFLERNFTRKYEIIWDKKGDITTFELQEERLGKYNILGSDFFK
ncbi:MAG: hypothetical protein OEV59_03795 [Deltaproteobacteria bacterium]|nr:hypothetical protein [Deltaproteobacteria bacterium]